MTVVFVCLLMLPVKAGIVFWLSNSSKFTITIARLSDKNKLDYTMDGGGGGQVIESKVS